MATLNGIDFLVIAVLAWGATSGFYRGLFRQVSGLLILYIATVLAAQYYRPVTQWLVGSSEGVAVGFSIIVFLGILVFTYFLLSLIISDLLRTYGSQRPLSLKGLVELGGMAVGFVQISLWVGLTLILLSFSLSVSWLDWEPARQMLLDELSHSTLASLIINYLSQASVAIEPWVPAGIPPVLASSL